MPGELRRLISFFQQNFWAQSLKYLLVIQAFQVATPATGPGLDPNYRKLRDAQPEESLQVKDLVLRRDIGLITLHSGTISFTPPVLGRVTKGIFSGEGEFTLKPATPLETNNLKRLTGADSIRESFRQAVFCFTDSTFDEIRGGSGAFGSIDPHARDILQTFYRRIRQRPDEPQSAMESMLTSSPVANIEAEILADLYNPTRPGFFNAYITGRQHDDLRFFVNPRGALSFLPSPEEVAVVNLDPKNEHEGIWYLAHFAA